jgi:hypothetical protein
MATKKQGHGRPRKRSEDAKSQSVLLRLGPQEKKGFTDAANIAEVPLAVWMRERLRRAAIRDLEEAGRSIPFLGEEG